MRGSLTGGRCVNFVCARVQVLSRIGKVFLQMGALAAAEASFASASAAAAAANLASPRSLLNQGLLAFAKNDYKLVHALH